MFVWSYRGVVIALLVIGLALFLLASGHYAAAKPWIDGVLIVLVTLMLVRMWFGSPK
jgi:predicted Co/Zn/Cd cation transporter (cation efflux family)